jgi:hypothetical protein
MTIPVGGYAFTAQDERVHALEIRWPHRGEHAPWCGEDACHLRSVYVYWVGVEAVGNYCRPHGEARYLAAIARGGAS